MNVKLYYQYSIRENLNNILCIEKTFLLFLYIRSILYYIDFGSFLEKIRWAQTMLKRLYYTFCRHDTGQMVKPRVKRIIMKVLYVYVV